MIAFSLSQITKMHIYTFWFGSEYKPLIVLKVRLKRYLRDRQDGHLKQQNSIIFKNAIAEGASLIKIVTINLSSNAKIMVSFKDKPYHLIIFPKIPKIPITCRTTNFQNLVARPKN